MTAERTRKDLPKDAAPLAPLPVMIAFFRQFTGQSLIGDGQPGLACPLNWILSNHCLAAIRAPLFPSLSPYESRTA